MTQVSPLLAWSPALEFGIPELDAQHKALMLLVNRFAAEVFSGTSMSDAADAMADLLAATREHFIFEEGVIRDCAVPDADSHREQHEELLASMERLWLKLQRDRLVADKMKELGFLRDWFLTHIVHSDSQIAPYYHRQALAKLAGG